MGFRSDFCSVCICFILGMAQYVSHFAEPGDPNYAPPKPEVETPVCFSLSIMLRLSDIYSLLCFVLFGKIGSKKGENS